MRIATVWRLLQSRVLAAAVLGAALALAASSVQNVHLDIGQTGLGRFDLDLRVRGIDFPSSIDLNHGSQTFKDKDGKSHIDHVWLMHTGTVGR